MMPKITNAVAKPNFVLNIEFDNHIWKSFSVVPYLDYPVFKPLSDIAFFNTLKVKYDTIIWGEDENIDFDPYTLWTESIDLTTQPDPRSCQ